MATITEDYVSFEIAKLLKEKGFEGVCRAGYTSHGSLKVLEVKEYLTNKICPDTYWNCIAPTIQMVMKWLREVHNIMVSPYALSLGYYFEVFDLINMDITGCKPLYNVGIPNKEDVLPTYEQACEEAIKYCLKNLI